MFDLNDPSDECYAFVAKLGDLKNLSIFLRPLNIKERGNFSISKNGLKVTVEESKTMQFSSFIDCRLFDEFTLRSGSGDAEDSDEMTFNLSIHTMMVCLEQLGEDCHPYLKLCYEGYGKPLVLFIYDEGVTIECMVKTRDAEDYMDFNFVNSAVLAKVIFTSKYFKDIITSLDTRSEFVLLKITDQSVKFTTSTVYGECDIEVENDSDMIDLYTSNSPVFAKYQTRLLIQGFKALTASAKVSIRVDTRDCLCIQHLIETDDGGRGYLEFYCVPMAEEEDGD